MKKHSNSMIVACVLPALLAGGCGKGKEINLTEFFFGPDGPTLVAMVLDDDADRRWDGITKLCKKDWGLRDPYLAYFALCLEGDEAPTVRSAAARGLGMAGDPKYLPALTRALANDRSENVRWDAAVALGKVRGEEAVEPLRKAAAEDSSLDVRVASARALRLYRDPGVVRALVYCLTDEAFDVRYAAHESLVRITGKDLGFEPGDWTPLTGAEYAVPPFRWQRPWWDWFGVKDVPEELAPSTTRPAPKPWWDWMGVTRRRSYPPAESASQPTSAPATAPATRPAK